MTVNTVDPPYWETAGLISINDHPDIRRAFDGLHMEQISIRYTVGGGGHGSDAMELLIWNDNCEAKRGAAKTRDMFGGRKF